MSADPLYLVAPGIFDLEDRLVTIKTPDGRIWERLPGEARDAFMARAADEAASGRPVIWQDELDTIT